MNHNKLEHAEELKRTYDEHYVASQNAATLKNIIARYEGGTDQPIHDRLSVDYSILMSRTSKKCSSRNRSTSSNYTRVDSTADYI